MQKTSDYSKFRQVDGNRKVNSGHVNRLASAIERKNLLQYFPVLLNEDMEVIDGQHRLSAAAKLELPIYYEIVPGLTLTDVVSINTNSKSWNINDFIDSYIELGHKGNINDFIDSYIELGHKDYEVLREFMNTYHFNASTSAMLLGGYNGFFSMNTAKGGGIAVKLKSGDFKVASVQLAEKIAKQVQELKHYTDFDGAKDREFIGALLALNNNHDFDFDRFAAKLRLKNLLIEKRPTTKYYLIHIEELYNHCVYKNNVELYKSTQEVNLHKIK